VKDRSILFLSTEKWLSAFSSSLSQPGPEKYDKQSFSNSDVLQIKSRKNDSRHQTVLCAEKKSETFLPSDLSCFPGGYSGKSPSGSSGEAVQWQEKSVTNFAKNFTASGKKAGSAQQEAL